MLGVDWATVGAAGAFVLGAAFGVIIATRLVRSLLEVVLHARRRIENDDDT